MHICSKVIRRLQCELNSEKVFLAGTESTEGEALPVLELEQITVLLFSRLIIQVKPG